MNILIIGGTSFIGRHLVEAAHRNGHDITLFNRGLSNPTAFPELRHITGDRMKDADKLAGQKWDAVIDTCAYAPADLKPVLEHIDTDFYVFVSTVSVYNDYKNGPPTENSAVWDSKTVTEESTGQSYGALKVQAEKTVLDALGNRVLIVRPSIVAGPYDPTDRFTFWVSKLTEGGETLIPGDRTRKVQWIDARDLADFVVLQIEKKTNGIYNVAADSVDMESFVSALATKDSQLVWVDDAFLLDQGIEPFDIPLWIPKSEEYPEGYITVQTNKAKEAGLKLRSASETANDIREWVDQIEGKRIKAGLSREKELQLLALYESQLTTNNTNENL